MILKDYSYSTETKGLLRLKQVLEIIPVSKATWWNGVRTGRFPRPVKNGRCTFWTVVSIKALIENMAGGEAK